MKSSLSRIVLAIVVILAGCSTLPPQSRPADIDPFLGTWTGTWNRPPWSGGVDVVMTSASHDTVVGEVRIFGGSITGYTVLLTLHNGELRSAGPTSSIVFQLHGDRNMEATFKNPTGIGSYSLSKKL